MSWTLVMDAARKRVRARRLPVPDFVIALLAMKMSVEEFPNNSEPTDVELRELWNVIKGGL